jgi:hypothetical protein
MIYKFDFCETASLEISKERFKNAENVYFEDTKEKGKKITVQREDGKEFIVLIPLDMFEVLNDR